MTSPPASRDEHPRRPSPPASQTSSALAEEQALLDDDDDVSVASIAHRARRRSSVSNRLASVADIGGVNSFRSFARSWHRAASFAEVIPRRPSLVLNPDQRPFNDLGGDGAQPFPYFSPGPAPAPHTSLLGQHLERSPWSASWTSSESSTGVDPRVAAGARDDLREGGGKALLDTEMAAGALPPASPPGRSTIFAAPPHLATPSVIGSYGSFRSQHYGTIRSRPSFSHASGWRARRDDDGDVAAGVLDDDDAALGEHQPILVKEVKQGDKIVLAVEGQSTLPQSIFNSVNALIGIGLLSLPLALKMSGWLIGLPLLTLMALVATHTGKLLGKCMEMDPSLITYSDLAYVSFGARARVVVSALFTLELIGACVALMILFADSLDLLLPGFASVNIWKCICAVLVLILNTLPLRLLSYTSVVGIFSTCALVCIVVADGLVKHRTPGSLWEPAATHLLPSNWLALPLAYGLLASPWGAHCVFPSIYRDMRHPSKWKTGVNVSFSFSYALDTCLAIVGILMFGDGIKEMVTSNILDTPGFPEAPTILMCVFIAIIPLTKIPLNSRPLVTTADVVCGLHPDQPAAGRRSAIVSSCLKALVRVLVFAVLLLISIVFPAFDSVCAFLGAALCSIISIILPISFYLKLYWRHISLGERVVSWLLLGLFSTLGLVGTIWSFLPKHLLGSH
ncbi:transmembrane amino acid transporter protein [Hirsutella rhossiliensis]|uniref:Transmembrane amino acid transporter protein n=1 Tax=Hirsutella rhossiliensis TaxID=111463 RepID=A0A9P8MRZ7_9HYPO|nr:transmembrane amino acid transporter protein [Hirsutella rhossiliensis]KAH0960054.1 transmembrane amino acid transporter protein [Hirsutella rhossiliensis]